MVQRLRGRISSCRALGACAQRRRSPAVVKETPPARAGGGVTVPAGMGRRADLTSRPRRAVAGHCPAVGGRSTTTFSKRPRLALLDPPATRTESIRQ
jgi:hypothetical protein